MPIDYKKFKEAFLSEASTCIKLMNKTLLELEKNPHQTKLFQEIIRVIHTLKSLSATMNYNQSMMLCHTVEDVLEAIRTKQIQFENSIDILFECFDYLNENLKSITISDKEIEVKDLIQKLQNILTSGKNISNKKTFSIQKTPILEKIRTIDVKVKRLDILMNLAEELLVNKMKFDAIEEQSDHPELTAAVETFGRLITELQYHVMQIRLVPIDFIFNRFSRMVRDLAKQEKKEINLEMEGGEIEFDRLLIDEIGESLVHLVKNAIDHGLETPKNRQNMHKPSVGTIRLSARRFNETAVIEVSDDGAGLDLKSIKNLAIQQKLLKPDAIEEEVIDIIFSNLSTKQSVTTVSGRGLGLAIVKQKIESIGGSIRVKSHFGYGTTFHIEIPLSLAIIKTLFVKVCGKIYAIPIEVVKRLIVVTSSDFKGLLQYEAIIFEGHDIPIIRLSELFGETQKNLDKQSIVIIHKDDKDFGLVVDGLLSTEEVVVKPLSRFVKNNQYFSGAALVGSGQMVLILDVANLLPTKRIADVEVD